MMTCKKLITAFFLCLTLTGSLFAQRNTISVLAKPSQFAEPMDYYDDMKMSPEMERFINATGRSMDGTWVVYSDRDNNELFDKVDGTVVSKMAFGDPAWVIQAKGNWLQLIKYDPYLMEKGGTRLKKDANPVVLGWVKRENLLLWNRALRDTKSGVEKKVVLINTDALGVLNSGSVTDTIPIWGTPQSKYPRKGMLIYSFFYVLKKEGDMYLIAKDASFLPSTESNTSMRGWVSRNRASEWNTRIALEPNIDLRAYNERKKEPNYHVAHYQKAEDARAHATTGKRQTGSLMTVADPVTDADRSSPEYPLDRNKDYGSGEREQFTMKRFDGPVLRFPVLRIDKEGLFYETTVVDQIRVASLLDGKSSGTISETTLALSEKASESYRSESNNWNVVLLIEGTAALLPYRDRILQVVDEIDTYVRNYSSKINLRMGAVVYRDVSHEQSGKLMEYKQKGSVGQLRPWLEQVRLYTDDPTDDDRSAKYYGLQQALNVGGFAEDQVNILVHLGAGGDVSRSAMRKIKEKGHPAFLSEAANQILEEQLSDLEVNVLSLQIRNEGGQEHSDMLYDLRNTLMVSAQNANQDSRTFGTEQIGMQLKANPSMPSPGDTRFEEGAPCRLQLKEGRMIGHIFSPGKNASISSAQISGELGHFLEETRNYVEGSRAEVSKVLSEGRSLDEVPSEYQDVVINQIRKKLENKISRSELEALRHLRFRLMQKSYVPAKVAGMKHDLLSYVVLMDQKELLNTINRLEQISQLEQQAPGPQRQGVFYSLLEQCNNTYLGGNVSEATLKKMDYKQFARILLGIAEEGIILPTKVTWNLGDILEKSKVKDGDIYYYILHMKDNLSILKNDILHSGYPYKFDRNGVNYYWVPVEFTI